jgi:Fic family protein
MVLTDVLDNIDELKNEIDALRPIDAVTEQRIMQKFRLDWNYHSNNIEGNSLTFGETKSFLLHGITAEGKPLKDHLDLKGHNEAILLLDDIIKNERPLTETFIRELHKIILNEPYERPAITADGKPTTKKIEVGQYKRTPNHVKTATGEIFYFATPEETPAQMNDLMDWYARSVEERKLHPVVIAAEFHYKFIRIHPFDDGNGRLARILMNLVLMKYQYPPVIIKTQEKVEYYRALQIADGGDINFFDAYIAEQLVHSLNLFLKGARGENIEEEDDVDKRIALLKLKLNDAPKKIIYSDKTAASILASSILPVVEAVHFKLIQFEDFFHSKEVKLSFLGQNNVEYTRRPANIEQIKKEFNSSFVGQFLISRILLLYIFKEFLKTEGKSFDVVSLLEIKLHRHEFIASFPEIDTPPIKVYYHEGKNEKKINLIAKVLATKALNDIETGTSK